MNMKETPPVRPPAPPGVREDKKAWRRLAAELFRLTPPEARRGEDARLVERLDGELTLCAPRRLIGFAPLADEPDVTPVFRRWLAAGKQLLLPRWLGGECMELAVVRDWDAGLRPGRGGILEPAESAPAAEAEAEDAALAPGRFFSETRVRLGRGAGCYDALFARARLFGIGVAYDFQIVPSLPRDAGDAGLDVVVTPTRTLGRG